MEEQSKATQADVIERACNNVQKILSSSHEPQVVAPQIELFILISAARMRVEQLRAN